jgi:hypothetical protein
MNSKLLLIGATTAVLGVGAAFAADPPRAPAPPQPPRLERMIETLDANKDGFLSREEARAAAERSFDHMDADKDGRLEPGDRAARREIRIERREIHRDGKVEVTEEVTEGPGVAPPAPGGDVIIEKHVRKGDGHHGRRGDHRGGHREGGHHAPHAMPMGPPMMIFAHSGEADTNNDGAISKAEHVAQQLRFFDASDVNGDGKIKVEPPPVPPTAPAAPVPPEAPTAPPPPPRR